MNILFGCEAKISHVKITIICNDNNMFTSYWINKIAMHACIRHSVYMYEMYLTKNKTNIVPLEEIK